jgi:hypothetical protein
MVFFARMDLISGQESHEFMVFKYKFFHQKDLGCNHVLGHSNARTKKLILRIAAAMIRQQS